MKFYNQRVNGEHTARCQVIIAWLAAILLAIRRKQWTNAAEDANVALELLDCVVELSSVENEMRPSILDLVSIPDDLVCPGLFLGLLDGELVCRHFRLESGDLCGF
jgi:hypothetical protein